MTAFGHQGGREKRPELDRRQAWQEVARRVEGTFREGKRKGKDRVELGHRSWTLTLDTHTVNTGSSSVTYTRVQGFFSGRSELQLLVRKRYFYDPVLERLGFRGIPAGDRRLTRRFVVKGKPASRVRAVVTAGLAEAVLAQPTLRLEVKDASRKDRRRLGPDARLATVRVTGVIKDPDRLAGLFAVVRETLDALERNGLADRRAVSTAGR